MIALNLTVVGSATGVVLPGATGTKDFNLVNSPTNGRNLRRIAATATTAPEEITISHQHTGSSGTFSERVRSLVQSRKTRNDTDLTLTGGIKPYVSVQVTIDRPVNSGGFITTAMIKQCVGEVCDVLTRSGQLDLLLNEEA